MGCPVGGLDRKIIVLDPTLLVESGPAGETVGFDVGDNVILVNGDEE